MKVFSLKKRKKFNCLELFRVKLSGVLERVTWPRCVFKRFPLSHRLEVSRRVDAFLQDFSSAVVDSVPLVSGFVPFDRRGFYSASGCHKAGRWWLDFKSTALRITCTGKVTCNISGMGTIVSLDIISCIFWERYSVYLHLPDWKLVLPLVEKMCEIVILVT